MTVQENLLKLQWAQLKHDEAYHKDVVIMPLAERIKHMALHNAKYTAYFFDAVDERDSAKLNKTADSDDFAQAFRFQIAQDSDLISPTVPI